MERIVDEKYGTGPYNRPAAWARDQALIDTAGSLGGLEAEIATSGTIKAAADMQDGSLPWEKPEEPPAPSVLEKRLSNNIQQ